MIKNLGQIAGLWIGTSAPQNTKLIWYDSGNRIHKVYAPSSGTWIQISMNPIVNKTYTELQNLAAVGSISQGTFYRITNLGYLALAITSTKIQYTDNNNNVIIDDLISTKTYCVTSSNLLIEDKGGVWDVSTNTLKFNFEDTNLANETSSVSANDYILGTKVRNGVKLFSKYKLSSLISTVSNNVLTWNKGLFLNFLTNLQSYYDINGGVVRHETFSSAISTVNQSLTTLQNNIDNINIWSKELPSDWSESSTVSEPVITIGDTLSTIISKIQRWFSLFWHITSTRFYSRSVVSSTIPVFDFNLTDKEFKVSRSNLSYSSFSGGKNELKYSDSESLNFSMQSQIKNLIGSDFSFEITGFMPNLTAGRIILNSYTIKVDEPIIPVPTLSLGQVFEVNDIYSIYAKSLKTEIRASKISILDALVYDLGDNSANAQTFYITKDSPEHIVFYKSSGSNDLYMNFGINSLREGQIIGITFLSNSLAFGINLVNTGNNLPIWLPTENGNLGQPQLGGVSLSFQRNSEQKFVVLKGSQIGYSQYPLILTRLN